MRLFFVWMMTVMAVGFVSSAWAQEAPVDTTGTFQERCDAADTVVSGVNGEFEAVVQELEDVEKQLAELKAQKIELTAKRDAIRKARTDKRVAVKRAERSRRQACKQVIRCQETNEKVLVTKKVMDALVKELSEVKQQTGTHKKETAELLGKFEALGKQEGELQCRQLKGKGGEPATVNKCHDTYESYGELTRELTGNRKGLKAADKRYKKIASKNTRKQSELKYLGNRIRRNCAADGPEIQEVEQLQARQKEFDAVAGELAAIHVDVKKARKIKVKKPKAKRIDTKVEFAAAGKVEAKGAVEAKGSDKKEPAKKSEKKNKAKSSFEFGGTASAEAKGQIKIQLK